MIMEEFGSVIWLDPDVRIQSITDLNMLKYRGSRNFFLWEFPVFTHLVAYTHPYMFDFLDEKRCTFASYGMVDVKTMVLFRTNTTWHGIMKPWLKCALNKDCISPYGARNSECFHTMRQKYTGCHWYDQSALSIIMNRKFEFSSYPDKFTAPRFTLYEDSEIVYYFPEQPWTNRELMLFTCSPLALIAFFMYLLLKKWCRNSNSSLSRRFLD